MSNILTINVLVNPDDTWTIYLNGPPDPPELTFRAKWDTTPDTFPTRFSHMADVYMELLRMRNDKLAHFIRS